MKNGQGHICCPRRRVRATCSALRQAISMSKLSFLLCWSSTQLSQVLEHSHAPGLISYSQAADQSGSKRLHKQPCSEQSRLLPYLPFLFEWCPSKAHSSLSHCRSVYVVQSKALLNIAAALSQYFAAPTRPLAAAEPGLNLLFTHVSCNTCVQVRHTTFRSGTR